MTDDTSFHTTFKLFDDEVTQRHLLGKVGTIFLYYSRTPIIRTLIRRIAELTENLFFDSKFFSGRPVKSKTFFISVNREK